MAAALAGVFLSTSCDPVEKTDTKDYTQYVNTFIGAADNGARRFPLGSIRPHSPTH